MTTNQDKKAPKEKKLTKAEQREDQITTAFYMLARVVDQNTQMFNAFIDTMSESPEPAKVPATNAVRVSEVPVESYPAFLKRGATFIHEEL